MCSFLRIILIYYRTSFLLSLKFLVIKTFRKLVTRFLFGGFDCYFNVVSNSFVCVIVFYFLSFKICFVLFYFLPYVPILPYCSFSAIVFYYCHPACFFSVDTILIILNIFHLFSISMSAHYFN